MNSKKNDQFAEIAMTGISGDKPELEYPQPPQLPERTMPLQPGLNPEAEWEPRERIENPEQLKEELKRWKEVYRPYLASCSPELEAKRRQFALESFDWRVEMPEDRRSFSRVLSGLGSWCRVSIPHYGEPLGEAVCYYRRSFSPPAMEPDSRLYLCFKGADYIAHIFINDTYIGSHEGFFAPFEFDITSALREGENILCVKLENDYIFGGNISEEGGERYEGNKIYAATGPGYDKAGIGWHHCPPAMGIYQDVYLETRSPIHLHDLFVRPLPEEERAEAWIEIESRKVEAQEISVELSLYGENFEKILFEGKRFAPETSRELGLGDTFTEQKLRAQGLLEKPVQLTMEKGINRLQIPFPIPDPRLWEPEHPWLYCLQLRILDKYGRVLDSKSSAFGMRSFRLDNNCKPKGMFHLNGRPIRLRGANTMGFEQQCVMRRDWEQLIEDILLARICNMNFLRLTQRPVQPEVYHYCDRLGLMCQSDLPLFGVIKRDRWCEALRQAEEMERLVRSHPSNILISYINEPFPNASNKPHRHLLRNEMEDWFDSADTIVKLQNPDRVIKHIDGDYDPPGRGLPDNHCYTLWYNGHGIDAGLLHKGGWMAVRKGWNYGCGEFGVEGLENFNLMQRSYPESWLPEEGRRGEWTPNRISGAQSGSFYCHFYPAAKSPEQWIERSQRWQAQGLRMMSEAFRRDPRMVSFAVHLFIDAFPAGWMKTIMDCERNPKPGYFAYREALTPLMLNLRSDRFSFYAGEEAEVECWICNDTNELHPGSYLSYRWEQGGSVLASGSCPAEIPGCSSAFQGFLRFSLPDCDEVQPMRLHAALCSPDGTVLHDSQLEMKLFPRPDAGREILSYLGGALSLPELESRLSLKRVPEPEDAELLLFSYWDDSDEECRRAARAVEKGALLLLYRLEPGEYRVCGEQLEIKGCTMMPMHFAAPGEAFHLPPGVNYEEFRFWYDPKLKRIAPILHATLSCPSMTPIMESGNTDREGRWGPALAAGSYSFKKGRVVCCQVELEGRLESNPPAQLLAKQLLKG